MDVSWWPMACSEVTTCTLGNATDLRMPVVVSALDLGCQRRKLGWFGGGERGPFFWQRSFCTDSLQRGVACGL